MWARVDRTEEGQAATLQKKTAKGGYCHGWTGNELHHAKQGADKLIRLPESTLRLCVDHAISKMSGKKKFQPPVRQKLNPSQHHLRAPSGPVKYRPPPLLEDAVGWPDRALGFWNRKPLRHHPYEYCRAVWNASDRPPDAESNSPRKISGAMEGRYEHASRCSDHRRGL